jgi:hypothetical protein
MKRIDLSETPTEGAEFSHTDFILSGAKLLAAGLLIMGASAVLIDILKNTVVDLPFLIGLVFGGLLIAGFVACCWAVGRLASKVPFFHRRMLTAKAIAYAEERAPI